METMILAILFAYLLVSCIGLIIGLDLKKWSSWLFGLYGFLSGIWIGFISGYSSSGWQLGAVFALAVMYGGAMTRYNRQRYGRDAAQEWLSRYGQEKHFSLLARFIKKLLNK